MRALAIAFMVLCHVPIFTATPGGGNYPWLYFFANHIVGDFAAAIFLFLVGTSQAVSMSRSNPGSSIRKGLTRGGAIFMIGLLLSCAIRGPKMLFEWDILPLIGTSLILLPFTRHWKVGTFILVSISIAALAPGLRGLTDHAAQWGGRYEQVPAFSDVFPRLLFDPVADYTPPPGFLAALRGFFLIGTFPFLPWGAFPLIGYAVGLKLVCDKERRLALPFLLCGTACALAGLAAALAGRALQPASWLGWYAAVFSFYPLTTSLFLLQLGVIFLIFAPLRRWLDASAATGALMTALQRLSRYALSIYVTHLVLIYWPLWIAGWLAGEPARYQQNALSTPAALALAAGFLLAMWPLLALWDRIGGRYSLEWFLNQILLHLQRGKTKPSA